MTSLAGQERRSFYRKREAAEAEALVSSASRESSRAYPVQCYFYLLFKKIVKEKKSKMEADDDDDGPDSDEVD